MYAKEICLIICVAVYFSFEIFAEKRKISMLQAFRYFIRLLPAAVLSAFCFSGFCEWWEYGDHIDTIKARAAWQPGDEEVGSYSILAGGWLLCGALAWHYFFKMFKSLFGS